MKRIFVAATSAALLAAPLAAPAQERAAVVVGQTEAVVKVVKIDRKARLVTFQGPKGRTETLQVPKEAQNLDQVKVGSTFRMKYVEAVAVALQRGGTASASADRQVRLAPKGGNPGGVVVETSTVSAKVQAIDYANRELALVGPKGNAMALHVADEVQGFSDVKVGDTVSVAYTRGLALEMLPEPAGPPKAKPTPK
jgi:hypothetical protein